MIDIDQLNNSSFILKSKIPIRIIFWQIILLLTLILILNVGVYYEYSKYEHYIGTVINAKSGYNVNLLLPQSKLVSISDYKLLIDGNYKKFDIVEINEIYQIDENMNKYYEVTLKLHLTNNYQKSNLPIMLKFESKKTTLMYEIIKTFKKGMM